MFVCRTGRFCFGEQDIEYDNVRTHLMSLSVKEKGVFGQPYCTMCHPLLTLAVGVRWLILNNRMHCIRSDKFRASFCPSGLIGIISSPQRDCLISPSQMMFFSIHMMFFCFFIFLECIYSSDRDCVALLRPSIDEKSTSLCCSDNGFIL